MPNTILNPSPVVPAPDGPNKKKKKKETSPLMRTATAEKKPAKQ